MENKQELIGPKKLLRSDMQLSIGDVVTTYDNSDVIIPYIVKDISDGHVTVCRVEETKNSKITDILLSQKEVLYLGDSFLNINSRMWMLYQTILLPQINLW